MSLTRGRIASLTILALVALAATPALAGASLDIRPSTCPNIIDQTRRGVVPVALVGDVDFVVAREGIDVFSLRLARGDGVGATVRPTTFRSRAPQLVDVAAPAVGDSCSIFGADGILDYQLYFRQQWTVRRLQLDVLPHGHALDLCLSGQTLAGDPFEVCDEVTITDFGLLAEQPDDGEVMDLP